MAERPGISVTIITLNEAENLPRCLASLAWAEEVIVVDSGSSDSTCEIAREAGAKVLERAWEGYGQQKNYAMDQATHDWVLNLDADEVVSAELQAAVEQFVAQAGKQENSRQFGARFARKTWFLGRWIMHGGWYPNLLTRLCHRRHARWTEPPVHEELKVDGEVVKLDGELLHYTFRNVADQVRTNIRYAREGALAAKRRGEHPSFAKMMVKPWIKFCETYLWKRGFLDGLPGLIISINAAHSIFMKYAELYFVQTTDHR